MRAEWWKQRGWIMSPRPQNWRQIVARNRDNPINRAPPSRFPYLEELMRDPQVIRALDQAWRDTNADVIPVTAASEQGGWIYMNLRTGRLTIIRKDNPLLPPERPGENQRGAFKIRLDPCVIVPGSILVACFHTHPSVPFTGSDGDDRDLGVQYGVPGIIRGRNIQYDFVGPERRAGDFHTAARFPGFPP
jgi:hypothetical protein